MDKNFLEFWGNSLLNAAKSQEQFEKMAAWAQQGFKDFEEMSASFLKVYGLGGRPGPEKGADIDVAWKKTQEEFLRSLNEYMNMLGFVLKSEHLELVKKYEEIKEKLSSREETIKHLRMLLSESKIEGQGELASQFSDLVRRQNEQFRDMVDNVSKAFKDSTSDKETGEA